MKGLFLNLSIFSYLSSTSLSTLFSSFQGYFLIDALLLDLLKVEMFFCSSRSCLCRTTQETSQSSLV